MSDVVLVIVNPEFGDRLEGLSESISTWVVDTPPNKIVCQRLWKIHLQRDVQTHDGLTSFTVENLEARSNNLLRLLPALEDHHGPSYTLRVFGLKLDDQMQHDLEKWAFSSFEELGEGFEARR